VKLSLKKVKKKRMFEAIASAAFFFLIPPLCLLPKPKLLRAAETKDWIQ
jgi:hypothetical protein